jgi:hypothetical protein
MQCGTAVHAARSPQPGLRFAQPAVVGGVLLGLLSTIPIVQAGNLFFGAWIVGGGAVAAHLLMKQRTDGAIGYGDGAFGGVLSGFVGAIVATLMLIPNKWILPDAFDELHRNFEQQFNNVPDTDGPMKELLLRAMSREVSLTTELVYLFIFAIFFSLIAMFGGILMVWISKRRKMRRA